MEYPVQDWPSFMGADVLGGFLEVPGYYRAKGWMRRANAISPVGDETRNKVVENRTEAEERQIKRTGVSPPFEGDAPGLSQILSLRDAVEAKGGHFYVVFPGQLDRNNYHTDPAYEGNFVAVETLFREHDLKLLNGMEEALLPIDQMYDMIYHPNDAGRTRISRPAAKALARSLKAEGVITRDTMESSS